MGNSPHDRITNALWTWVEYSRWYALSNVKCILYARIPIAGNRIYFRANRGPLAADQVRCVRMMKNKDGQTRQPIPVWKVAVNAP